ncbi:hypothetical protein BK126_26565 [Paenibacillus sp. FSL H7-0326]|uniref:hypothetical protein n=1 Tax=Paenibacillus sp. FSL H7-0326 TaxID=1921144 RepID=UPI00096C00CF|nr:hypothetical protein [Paenibacillus sp. FSL H7-0326]OMC63759.1 hypothetical protein BK126_26565 [Paenibacillus sp. FSL H7-0326]
MIISVELFTKSYQAELSRENNEFTMNLTPESMARLEEYLRVVLPHYIDMPEDTENLTLDHLMKLANDWQLANPDQSMTEPHIKLPYLFDVSVKEMLSQLAEANNVPMTKVIIQLIDEAYERVVINDEAL